ncbi:MAG: chloride channel protein [bacterium]
MRVIPNFKFNELLEKAKLKEGTFLIFAAILIGIVAGCAFLFFHWLIDFLSNWFIGESTENSIEGYKRLPIYFKILMPLAGVFISGFIIRYISKESGGAGIGLLLKFMKVKNGIMPPAMIFFKIVTSALSVATGVPLGTEGPIIIIGSAVGSTIGQFLNMSISRIKLFVGCGAAAGLAVAFNAPIAGTILAVETILGNYAIGTLTPIVVAAATASFFGSYFLPGHEVIPSTALGFSSVISSGSEILLFIAFGLVNAFLGVGLIKLTYTNSNLFEKTKQKLPEFIHIPLFLIPFALTAPFIPEIFGLGKDVMVAANGFSPQFLIGIAVLKLFFLSIAFASGASGGIFLPILFVGYIFGMGFGKIVPLLFPEIDPSIGLSFATVGIGALLGAATQEPISSLLIVFEITRDYNMMPSLMLATVVAVMISKSLSKFSIYNYQLFKEGIPLEENEEVTIMNENHVEICFRTECVTATLDDKLPDIVDKMQQLERFECYVIDEKKKYLGTINGVFGACRSETEREKASLTTAKELLSTDFPKVYLDSPLSEAVRKMIKKGVIELPVLDENGILAGCIHEHDIIDFYNREILSKGSLLKTVYKIEGTDQNYIQFEDEYRIEALNSTASMWGKSLVDLKLREKFNILVLAVKEKKTGKSILSPTKVLEPGDVLIAAGTEKDLALFKDYNKI